MVKPQGGVTLHLPPLQPMWFPDQGAADGFTAEMDQLWTANPLHRFYPHACRKCKRREWLGQPPCAEHDEPQYKFLTAPTRVVAAFAGNQFGKSTVLTVGALREALPKEWLPDWLRPFQRFGGPTDGWILVPSEAKIDDSFRPAFIEWTPPAALHGGSWGKAYNGASMTLRFACGSTIGFKTYKQDASTLGGARLHYVGYDEPPPKPHREEGMTRTVRYGGFEMFAMTPLKVNTGYAKREIWKKRDSPDITVVRGSIYDNDYLAKDQVDFVLGSHSDIWRRAREFGDFVDVGGLIFPDFERCVVAEHFPSNFLRQLDVVVGIDPGIRNAGFAWVGFDKNLTAYVFNEGLLQNKEAKDYASFIRSENRRLGLDPSRISYVCDPAARSRGQVTTETVMAALIKEGIYANTGQNDHEAGFDQMRTRMSLGRFKVSPLCRGLRDEADDYAAKEPGEFDDDSHLNPVSNQFHRMDALRYAVMERFWDPAMEQLPAQRNLGYRPGHAPPLKSFITSRKPLPSHPLGDMA